MNIGQFCSCSVCAALEFIPIILFDLQLQHPGAMEDAGISVHHVLVIFNSNGKYLFYSVFFFSVTPVCVCLWMPFFHQQCRRPFFH